MKSPFKGQHFSGEIILFCVRWYCQTALSYQQLSDMLHERGVEVNKTTIWRWIQKYAPELKKRVMNKVKFVGHWHHIDETVIKVKGEQKYLYRAIDRSGNTIDFMLSHHKSACSARRFFVSMLNKPHVRKSPKYIITDKNLSFPAAVTQLKKSKVLSRQTQWAFVNYGNNRLEQDHRFTKTKVNHSMSFHEYHSAKNTIEGYEVMHMIKKGQVRHVAKNDPRSQYRFIQNLFGISV